MSLFIKRVALACLAMAVPGWAVASTITHDAASVTFGDATIVKGNPAAARLSERSDRDIQSVTLDSGIDGISAKADRYTKSLDAGGSYTRTILTYTNTTSEAITLDQVTVNETTAFTNLATASIQQIGNTDGAVVQVTATGGTQNWFAVEHPFSKYSFTSPNPDSGTTTDSEFLRKRLTVSSAKTTYTLDDLASISQPSENHTTGMGMLYIPITTSDTSVVLTLQYKSGSWAALFGNVTVFDTKGLIVQEHGQAVTKTGSSGTYMTTIKGLTSGATYLLAVDAGADYNGWSDANASSSGDITLSGATATTGTFHYLVDESIAADDYTYIETDGTGAYTHADIADDYLEVPLLITGTSLQLTVDYLDGNHGVEIEGLELYTEKGDLVTSIEQDGFSGNSDTNNVFAVTLDSTYVGNYLIARFNLWIDNASPDHKGQIICSGATITSGFIPTAILETEDSGTTGGETVTVYPEKTTYTYEELQSTNEAMGTTIYGHGIINVPILINKQSFSVTILCNNGAGVPTQIYVVELINYETGEVIATNDYVDGSTYTSCSESDAYTWGNMGNRYNEQSFEVSSDLVGKYAIVRFYVGAAGDGSSSGTFSASGATLTAITETTETEPEPEPEEPAEIEVYALTGYVPLGGMSLAAGKSITISYVTGTVDEASQFRRAYNQYLNAERAHPHRMLPHYNSWYDICINRNDLAVSSRFTEDEALASMQAFRTKLWEERGVSIDSYLWDDGWDDWNSLWDFNDNFQPQGFSNLADEAHKVPGASIGAWMSPFGGYGGSFSARVAYAKSQGYIPSSASGLDMSAETYYNAFRDRVLQMITDYDMNLFKFDRMGSGGDATGVSSGYNAQLMAVGNLCAEMRAAKPDVFINATVGTWGSPYWLMWADSIWRGGNDCAASGTGTARQKWLTYRDNIIYNRFVNNGCLLPLNSIMMHGIIVCKSSPSNTMIDYKGTGSYMYNGVGYATPTACADFASEVWMGMMLGTGLQEYYITPSFMSDDWWDILAKGVKYLKANATILTDSHWIGGNPSSTIYGYASLGDRKGIVTLRNPTAYSKTVSSSLDSWLEMPEALQGRTFTFKTIFNSTAEYENAGKSGAFTLPAVTTTDSEASWTLPAYATVVFEVNFANSSEVVIDASQYTTLSAWKADNSAIDLMQKDIILDFGNITTGTTFSFDTDLATFGALYIVGEHTALATVAVSEGMTFAALGGTTIETSIMMDAATLSMFGAPEIIDGAVVTLFVYTEEATLAALPTGSGEVRKIGPGTLNLAGGVYRVQMTVSEGNMTIDGAAQFTEMVAVNSGATLTVDAETTFSGLVAPNGTMVLNAPVAFDRNLSVSSAGAQITGTATLTQNCNVQVASGASLTVAAPVVLGTTIAKSGAGSLTFNGGDITVTGSIGINYGACAMTVAEGKTLAGNGTVGLPITLADGSAIDGADGAVTVSDQVTAEGTVSVTNADPNTPFLTYTGTKPANPGVTYLAENLYATAAQDENDVVTLTLVNVAMPQASETITVEEADAAALAVTGYLESEDLLETIKVTEITNPGAATVIEDATITLTPTGEASDEYTATFDYEFGVSELSTVTINGEDYIVAAVELSEGVTFAEGVTVSLENEGDPVDADTVSGMNGTEEVTEPSGNKRYFRFPLPAEKLTFKLKAKAKK